jgi:abortive infection alpha-like protein
LEEESKAVQEVAKATRKGFELAEKLSRLLEKILGEGLIHLGGSFSDWAKYFRYNNLLKLQDRVISLHQKKGVEGQTIPVPPRYALPLIESASLEDDENLQEKWAGLISNATDPNKRFQFRKIYIQILSNLEPLDAIILDYLASQKDITNRDDDNEPLLNAENISDLLEIDKEDTVISLSNLFRLGCIIDSWKVTWDSMATGYQGFRINNPESNFRLSQLGRRLINSCKTT